MAWLGCGALGAKNSGSGRSRIDLYATARRKGAQNRRSRAHPEDDNEQDTAAKPCGGAHRARAHDNHILPDQPVARYGGDTTMKTPFTAHLKAFGLATVLGTMLAAPAAPAMAQAEEQFIPLLVYRTGQFAPLGI